jgi:C4-dicarboxylate-specific signal transduction histidine kinase
VTPLLAALLGTLGGFVLAALVVLWLHERREFKRQDAHEGAAQEREDRAVTRHEAQMRELAAAQRGYLGAINQRARLELRTDAMEAALNDHAAHLEALGRIGPVRLKLGGDG